MMLALLLASELVAVAGFDIGRTEVSQRQYEAVMGSNPSVHRGADLPVENVSWWDALRYCNERSRQEGLEPVYDLQTGKWDRSRNGYRLPTEAEWTAAFGSGKQVGNLRAGGTKNTKELRGATLPVGTSPPNEFGLHDMAGNVWEWCYDPFNPAPETHAEIALERVVRGGSFLSTGARTSRSSRAPDLRSRYTGFRVARDGTRAAWMRVLERPAVEPPKPHVRLLERVEHEIYTGELLDLQTEADSWERVLILRPRAGSKGPRPVVIVPFYDVDTPVGRNLGGRRFTPMGTRAFAFAAVQRGYTAVAIRWFGESYGESYDEAVANLARRHPGVTGLGKWIWDAERLLDYLGTLKEVDPKRIAMFGHSLGGKMTLYAAAFDRRIAAAVASEPGIGLKMSNYEDFWYLGERIRLLPEGADHHELLAMIAPRPFLLIAGEDSDGEKSLPLLDKVRPLFGDKLGFFNHKSGHGPTEESVRVALDWIAAALGI